MIEGLLTSITPQFLMFVALGVLIGIPAGALPGLTATVGVALVLPFTFGLPPEMGLAMLGALYISSMFADAVPAILVRTPGSPGAMATMMDGYPMTQQGRAREALVAAGFASLVGGVVGGIAYLFFTPTLSAVALTFGPPEMFWLGVFALTLVGGLSGGSLARGIFGAALGIMISGIGISSTGAVSRFSFGLPELRGGIEIVAALIGVFAFPQVLRMIDGSTSSPQRAKVGAKVGAKSGAALRTIADLCRRPVNLIRSGLIGTLVGILPGAGGPIAALVSYNEASRWGKKKDTFGKGNVDGVVASETANSSAAGGAMIPLVSLGVPGSAPAAVILGGLLLHGLNPGPRLMDSDPGLVFSFGWALIWAALFTAVFAWFGSGLMARVASIPVIYLAPTILFLTVIGSYAARNSMFDVYGMLALGLLTYGLSKLGVPAAPIGLGIILGPILEPPLVQALSLAQASSMIEVFFGRPISMGLIALIIISALLTVVMSKRKSGQSITAGAGND